VDLIKDTAVYRWSGALWRRRFAMLSANRFLQFAPPGHFYSPIPDLTSVARRGPQLFNQQVTEIAGISIDAHRQLELVEKFGLFYEELPFGERKSRELRYYFNNPFFSYGDAIGLYSMLRLYRPHRVVEIGSGYSSAVMLDTNDRFLSKSVRFTFIEPHPERLLSLLSLADQENHQLIAADVQDVPTEHFRLLESNDMLFIDSSHVLKAGSDVVHLLSVVLPSLKRGVLVHFHDIFWPFEYPESWLLDGRAWNEAYGLKAFLQFNSHFEIAFFNSYLSVHHTKTLEKHLPLFLRNPGGSLWLRKTA
jgi:predicted O-methyltransferase YrrM